MSTSVFLRSSNDALGNSQRLFDLASGETITRATAALLDEDFTGAGQATIPSNGAPATGYAWVKRIQKTSGSPTVAIVANSPGGVVQLALDATSEKQEASLYSNDQLNWDVTKTATFEARIAASVLPTGVVEMVWGFRSAWIDGPDNFSDYLDFQMLGSGAVNCRSKDGITTPSTPSGITLVAGAFHNFRIDATDPTNVAWSIDNVQVNVPRISFAATGAAAILQPYISVYKASGTGVGSLQVDSVQCGMNRS
jgi:hypothetical protein